MASYEEIQKSIRYLYYVYSWYIQLDYTSIIMDWNGETNRFYIKEKKGKPKNISFKNFFDYAHFWSVMC